ILDAHTPEIDGFTLADRIKVSPELAGTRLMMMTSVAHPADVCRCQALGIATALTKPVKPSELLDGIVRALKDLPVKPASAAQPQGPVPPAQRRLHILLAEDNAVNQKVAVRLLENRGHTVVVVENGKATLAALERQPFDLVLMDVQMPEMDGFEA